MKDPGVIAQNAVAKQWTKLGSLARKSTYTQRTKVYTVSTGKATSAVTFKQENLKVLFSGFSTSRHDADEELSPSVSIKTDDRLALIPYLNLNTVPQIGDIIYDEIGLLAWEVKAKSSDPAPALWTLHLRPLKEDYDAI